MDDHTPDQPLLTIREAANAIGVTPKTLRRWADSGRIDIERTAGGHRRFPADEVRRVIADRHGAGVRMRPLEPPARPLPATGALLSRDGVALHRSATRLLYPDQAGGWFAQPAARGPLRDWLDSLASACASGDHEGAIAATQGLSERAFLAGASLLDCHSFLESFGAVVARAIEEEPASRAEAPPWRRLMLSLRQWLLHAQSGARHGAGSVREVGTADAGSTPTRSTPRARRPAPAGELQAMVSEIATLPDVEQVSIYLVDPPGLSLHLAARGPVGLDPGARPAVVALGEGAIGGVAVERRAWIVNDDPFPPRPDASARRESRPAIAAPLLDRDRLIGVLCVAVRPSRLIDQRDVRLVESLSETVAATASGRVQDSAHGLLERFRSSWRSAAGSLGRTR